MRLLLKGRTTTVLNRLPRLVSIALIYAFGAFSAAAASAHGVTLNLHHFLPADSAFHTQFVVPWTQKLERESGGRLRFHLHPAMELGGSPAELYDQVKEGKADIVWTVAGYTPERFPAFEVFELPFMVHSAQGASRALWEYVRLNDAVRREFAGVRLLAVHQHGAPQFHMLSRPVRSLADLKGLKIRTPTPVTSAFLHALGAAPVEMPITQVSEALGKGIVDGVLVSWDALPALRLEAAVKYHSEVAPGAPWLYSAVFMLAMNPASYKMLPDDLRKVISANSGIETSAWLGRVFDENAAVARQHAAERGDVIHVLSAEELAKWQAPAQAVIDAWATALDQRGLQGKALIDSARASLAEYDSPK
jgi:TRAP-type C4-dicarboxylate transport system substrate-binding protein